MNNNSADSWTRYWSQDVAHSCPGSFSGFYGSAVQEFWSGASKNFSPQSCVVELGCGNGGLLEFLANRLPAEKMPMLHGVDLARLTSDRLGFHSVEQSKRLRIQIHDQTDFCDLPFSMVSVDAALAQFSIEYGDFERTATELARVLKDGGELALVMHKVGSRLYRVAADERDVCRQALSDGGVFDCIPSLLPFWSIAATEQGRRKLAGNVEANRAREAFNTASNNFQSFARQREFGAYGVEILEILTRQIVPLAVQSVDQSRDALLRFRNGVVDHHDRIRALVDAALDSDGIERVRDIFARNRIYLDEARILNEQGHEIAWATMGKKLKDDGD